MGKNVAVCREERELPYYKYLKLRSCETVH